MIEYCNDKKGDPLTMYNEEGKRFIVGSDDNKDCLFYDKEAIKIMGKITAGSNDALIKKLRELK